MRKFLTHPAFLLIAVLITAGALLMGAKKAQGFSWFGLWTQKKNAAVQNNTIYMQKNAIDNIVLDVINAHTKIALGLRGTVAGTTTSNDIPSYLANSQRLLSTDIIAYLENASDKESAIDSLISQISYYRNQGVQFNTQLQENIQQHTLEYNRCETAKNQADTLFYQGLNEGDAIMMQQGLDQAQTNGSCQTKSRIVANAYKAMLLRVQTTNTTLTTLDTLLSQNRNTIINNYMLFKDSYLEQLIELRSALRTYSGTQ